ncbi:MAG: LytR C-terminal domain-containing protein [Candidatus Fermentibacteraceae bacterium]|nr:LytR C-terminal domain-containing protein [Candidatus Fermentibacteraceae bacterium]
MTSDRKFPWRWVIGGIALVVISLTILIPPPGIQSENIETEASSEPEPISEPDNAAVLITPDTIKVLVLNGTEIDGLAGRTQRELLRASTDSIVILTPYDPSDTDFKPYEETILISQLPDLSAAKVVANILGLSGECIVWEVPADGRTPIVDIILCLGEDMNDTAYSGE